MMNVDLVNGPLPKELWFIAVESPILKATSFYADSRQYVKRVRIIKRTGKGWRGEELNRDGSDPSYRHEYVWRDDAFNAYATEKEALKALLEIAQKRTAELAETTGRIALLVGDLAERVA